MSTYTKQTVFQAIQVLNTGLSVNQYVQENYPEIDDEVINLVDILQSEQKTDGYQHNPLLKYGEASGMWLNKYSYATGVRIWVDQQSADEYVTSINEIITRVTNFEFQYSIIVEDVDPNVLQNLIT